MGARRVLVCVSSAFAASLWLLVLSPAPLVATMISAVLFGAAYNFIVAIQGIWSGQVFAQRPSGGLGAVMFMMGFGLLLGPALAGLLANEIGLENVFLLGGAVIAALALFARREAQVAKEAPGPTSVVAGQT